MRRALKIVAVLALGLGWVVSGDEGFEVLTPELVAKVQKVQKMAVESEVAWDFVESLTVEVGSRPAGSEGDKRAVVWAQNRLRALGFQNVRAEPVEVPHWVRGHAEGEIVHPFPHAMVVAALGGSIGTPEGGIEAEVWEVPSLEDLEKAEPAAVEGKIIFINRRMRRTQSGAGYGEAVVGRGRGAAVAAGLGAVAVVIRSIGTDNDRIAHTGGMRYAEGVRRIPAAALSNPDADLLAAALQRGPVRFRLELGCRDLPPEMSANVIGEIVGSEKPEEIVLLAAHLDSWDLGLGAVDDGSGCAIVADAARLVGQLGTPRRTLRVLLAANEEFGLSGARAYAEKYAATLDQHVVAMEADFGAGRVWAYRSKVGPSGEPLARDLAKVLAPLDIEYQDQPARGGADLIPLGPARVPLFDLAQDGTLYFDIHHTINDTLDKVDPEALRQNVAAYATAALVASEWSGDLGRAATPDEAN